MSTTQKKMGRSSVQRAILILCALGVVCVSAGSGRRTPKARADQLGDVDGDEFDLDASEEDSSGSDVATAASHEAGSDGVGMEPIQLSTEPVPSSVTTADDSVGGSGSVQNREEPVRESEGGGEETLILNSGDGGDGESTTADEQNFNSASSDEVMAYTASRQVPPGDEDKTSEASEASTNAGRLDTTLEAPSTTAGMGSEGSEPITLTTTRNQLNTELDGGTESLMIGEGEGAFHREEMTNSEELTGASDQLAQDFELLGVSPYGTEPPVASNDKGGVPVEGMVLQASGPRRPPDTEVDKDLEMLALQAGGRSVNRPDTTHQVPLTQSSH